MPTELRTYQTPFAVISSAVAAGEEAKDNQYFDIANQSGGDFIPLVCESFGAWTPSALSTLFLIAERSMAKNGLPRKVARRQLLQQLSVTLWHYNARMILRQHALSCDNGLYK